jgi:methylated-DNA-[protein]-cysteine S-methyltransferase
MTRAKTQASGEARIVVGGFWCRLDWTAEGIRRLRFGRSRAAGVPPSPPAGAPPFLAQALARLAAYFGGRRVDFGDLPVDLGRCSAFDRRVYAAARTIAYGRTLTYGGLAARAGAPGASRAVGGSMKRNPVPIVIPCHRVIRSDATPGGFSVPGGAGMKRRLLAMEGTEL